MSIILDGSRSGPQPAARAAQLLRVGDTAMAGLERPEGAIVVELPQPARSQSQPVGLTGIEKVLAFASGTLIATPRGPVVIDRLRPGDEVLTRDRGAQPLRWIGRRQVDARSACAPVLIEAGALGRHRALTLAPNHRVLMAGPRVAALFGTGEVLVAARNLVHLPGVRRSFGGRVTYLQMLFDRHEIVEAEGLATESLYPGETALQQTDAFWRAELLGLFPQLVARARGFGAPCRRVLSAEEAEHLTATGQSAPIALPLVRSA